VCVRVFWPGFGSALKWVRSYYSKARFLLQSSYSEIAYPTFITYIAQGCIKLIKRGIYNVTKISISNKRVSFELSVHQTFLSKKSITVSKKYKQPNCFNIDKKKRFCVRLLSKTLNILPNPNL